MTKPKEIGVYVWAIRCKLCNTPFRFKNMHRGCPKCGYVGECEVSPVPKEELNEADPND